MPTIEVTIQHGDDAAWPDLSAVPGNEIIHLKDEVWRLVGLGAGMTSGKPSVALRLPVPTSDGRTETLVAETSLAAWIAATCVLRDAFPEAFDGTPLGGGSR